MTAQRPPEGPETALYIFRHKYFITDLVGQIREAIGNRQSEGKWEFEVIFLDNVPLPTKTLILGCQSTTATSLRLIATDAITRH